jgi:hypothetical protein
MVKQMVMNIRREMPRIGTRKIYYLLKDQLQQHRIKLGLTAYLAF